MSQASIKSKYQAKYILNALSCSNCATKIEKAIQELSFVEKVTMNFAVCQLIIKGDDEQVEELTDKIQNIADKIEPRLTVINSDKNVKK